MFIVLLIFFVVLFLLEVVFGSCLEVYNAEIGFAADCKKIEKLPAGQFFFQLLPFAALCTGGLYLFLKNFSFLIERS